MLLADANSGLFWGAIPTAIATLGASWFAFKATRHAVPAIESAGALEPRIADMEKVSATWRDLFDEQAEQLVVLRLVIDARDQELRAKDVRIADLEHDLALALGAAN